MFSVWIVILYINLNSDESFLIRGFGTGDFIMNITSKTQVILDKVTPFAMSVGYEFNGFWQI